MKTNSKKLTDTQKLELLRELVCSADYDEMKKTGDIELLNTIHRIVHPDKDCPHQDWEDEAIKMYKKIEL